MKKIKLTLLTLVGLGLLCTIAYALLIPAESVAKYAFRLPVVAATQAKSDDYGALTSQELFCTTCTTTPIPITGASAFPLRDGNMAHLSFNQELQSGVRHFLEKSGVPYGIFVAVEPKTGRVLANVSYSSITADWEQTASFADYPMASLFKVITAAAAFEAGKATALTPLRFRGGACSESPSRWGKVGKSADAGLSLSDAMAHSVNPAFGRLAEDRLGTELLLAMARRFGFDNHPFGGDFIAPGTLARPASDGELMRLAAGLDHRTRISPFQVAMLFAAIGNGGTMPVPSFIDTVRDATGKTIYSLKPSPLYTVVTPAVATELIRAMSATVTTGTAKLGFRDPKGERFRSQIPVAGKTGSIIGDNPKGHYNWFAGIAPANNPKIAFVALTINGDILKLRAPKLGRAALDLFFRE